MLIPTGLLTEKEAAKAINCSVAALRRWRQHGIHLPFYRIGGQLVRYRREDLLAFVDSQRVETSEEAAR